MKLGKDMFSERERGLEDQFFYGVDQELVRQLRAKTEAERDRAALAAETGITDAMVLDELISLGITPEALMALSLVPLVQVAWADRTVDARERDAVLKAAHSVGLREGMPSFQLLKSWLRQKPSDKMFAAWKHYVAALSTVLSPDRFNSLRNDLVDRSRDIAKTTGGFLNLGSISAVEEAVLREIEAAFKTFVA